MGGTNTRARIMGGRAKTFSSAVRYPSIREPRAFRISACALCRKQRSTERRNLALSPNMQITPIASPCHYMYASPLIISAFAAKQLLLPALTRRTLQRGQRGRFGRSFQMRALNATFFRSLSLLFLPLVNLSHQCVLYLRIRH